MTQEAKLDLDLFEIYGLKGLAPEAKIARVQTLLESGEIHPTTATSFLRIINFDLRMQCLAAAMRNINLAGE